MYYLSKKVIPVLLFMLLSWSVFSQQIIIDRVEQMPNIPEPYLMRDWKKVAQKYDSLVFNTTISGEYLPLTGVNEEGKNYPEHESAAMVSYVGQQLNTSAEGINFIPSVIGATLSGINKSEQFGHNWALMSEDFFNRRTDENIYLNNSNSSSGHDWWYETMPNVFFYQLNDLYPNTGDFNYQFEKIADRWLEAVDSMGGKTTPWQTPYMNYRAWNMKQMEPLISGVKEPEAAGAIAWLLYNAYRKTKNTDYLIGAEWAMEFLNNHDANPSYELQLPYGAYAAACMNAEIGTNYDLDKILNWCFNRGALRGWGTIVGKWGDYDCSGLIGEANDSGNDYAFLMNGFQQAAVLVPLVRYNEHYANAIGKWVLNMSNASRLFYSGFLPENQQDSEQWSLQHDPNQCIAHEALKQKLNNISPFSTGDAINGGWSSTNLALYGSSHVGYLGGILDTTNVKAVLKLNLTKTDFYTENYPSYLFWNPYTAETTISINVGTQVSDIYNSISNSFIVEDATGIINITIPAENSVLLVYVPNGAAIEKIGEKTLANNIIIDYNNGETITDNPPRIKALKASRNLVVISDSVYIYCTAEDIDNDEIVYQWKLDDEILTAEDVLAIKAPENIGEYTIQCKISSGTGLTDSRSITLTVKDRIPYIPQINSIKSLPGKIDVQETTTLYCNANDNNGDELSYTWAAENGILSGSGSEVQWTSPTTVGDYKIYCTVADIDGETLDSTVVMVRSFDNLIKNDPVLYLPFNGNADDKSQYNNVSTPTNISYDTDVFGNSQHSAVLNGYSSYIKIENNDLLNFKSEMTLCGWIYSLHDNNGEAYPISHGNWENRWKVSLSNNTLRFTVKTSEGIYDLDSKTILNQEEWYYFSMVYTGTDMELYLNGELDAFMPVTGEIGTTSFDLIIGKARPDQDFYFKGKLDELYIFDHPLSPAHIAEMYEETVSSTNETHLDDTKIFPNPGKGDFIIYLGDKFSDKCEYQIFDCFGKKILESTNIESKYISLNVSFLSAGIYFLKIRNEEYSLTKKIIISN